MQTPVYIIIITTIPAPGNRPPRYFNQPYVLYILYYRLSFN
ncbi:hypothetical protein CLOSTASPAR_02330 [[Clostridium] asparagiforme DSM 15981]|uniref:Uncharacterized protein n=1 Tax=[Clostridium] asparagiforme DSM 15981 TaxID=518636 RepID=C0CZA3_9FIRM|nr:hypothetical protein CLOSTASPAR_02330 [[Clostridium] asparagiforme DSM 15981]